MGGYFGAVEFAAVGAGFFDKGCAVGAGPGLEEVEEVVEGVVHD